MPVELMMAAAAGMILWVAFQYLKEFWDGNWDANSFHPRDGNWIQASTCSRSQAATRRPISAPESSGMKCIPRTDASTRFFHVRQTSCTARQERAGLGIDEQLGNVVLGHPLSIAGDQLDDFGRLARDRKLPRPG
jgi:hypothetical protein